MSFTPSQDWETKTINSRPKTKKNANPEQVTSHARQSGYAVETVRSKFLIILLILVL